MKSKKLAVVAVGSLACLGALSACSGAPATDSAKVGSGEKTGMIVAAITAPSDVMCVQINVMDYGSGMNGFGSTTSYTDVTPGASATIEIGPLSPGYVYLTGDAYNVPCSTIEYPWIGIGGSSGGGGSGPVPIVGPSSGPGIPAPGIGDAGVLNPTWEADATQVLVVPGVATAATLSFHQLGSLDLSVNFQNCDPNSQSYQPWCYLDDGGTSFPPGSADAGTSSSSSSGSGSGVVMR